MAFGLAVGIIIVVAVIALVSSHLLFICAPNEILVFSGRGRAFRIPLLETGATTEQLRVATGGDSPGS